MSSILLLSYGNEVTTSLLKSIKKTLESLPRLFYWSLSNFHIIMRFCELTVYPVPIPFKTTTKHPQQEKFWWFTVIFSCYLIKIRLCLTLCSVRTIVCLTGPLSDKDVSVIPSMCSIVATFLQESNCICSWPRIHMEMCSILVTFLQQCFSIRGQNDVVWD